MYPLPQAAKGETLPDSVCTLILRICCQSTDPHAVSVSIQAFRRLRAVGLPQNIRWYNLILRTCARTGQWKRTVDLMAALQEEGLRPDVETFNVLIDGCEGDGRWQQAEVLFGARTTASFRSLPRTCRTLAPPARRCVRKEDACDDRGFRAVRFAL